VRGEAGDRLRNVIRFSRAPAALKMNGRASDTAKGGPDTAGAGGQAQGNLPSEERTTFRNQQSSIYLGLDTAGRSRGQDEGKTAEH
jgi:hypothetical protein